MSIDIYPNTKVYVVAPANTATGGPELLHQLVFHLRNSLNIQAYMYYIPTNIANPVHNEYKQYKNPFVRTIEDKAENLLIIPEVVDNLKFLSSYKKIRKAIWWLSVDNFFTSIILKSKKNFFFKRLTNKISNLFFNMPIFDINELVLEKVKNYYYEYINIKQIYKAHFHLAQSYYAMDFLKKIGIDESKIFYLSDYLNEEFLSIEVDLSAKEDIVAYSPKRGLSFTKKVIKFSSNIKFVPLINMSRKEIIETLKKAKVYIDFGNHPGKDRIPREAGILGCCVIVGKRGSASYFNDVPIPEEYKFPYSEEYIPQIVERLEDCLVNFEKKYKDFEYYRKFIKKEPVRFINDLKLVFKKNN